MANGDESVEIQGTRVPVLGFGTWLITGDDAAEAARDALEIGYRQIDTARAYENEREVGRGIADSGVARDEIFLTTKVPPDDASADDVQRDCEHSLERLGVDYLDLLLLHWPSPDVPLEETMKALTALRADGRIRRPARTTC
jgi:2,5-diketo-D-gluconate reductase B